MKKLGHASDLFVPCGHKYHKMAPEGVQTKASIAKYIFRTAVVLSLIVSGYGKTCGLLATLLVRFGCYTYMQWPAALGTLPQVKLVDFLGCWSLI